MPPERVPSDGQSTNHTVPLGILRCPRYARHHWPLTYEPALWSVVSPLGMYSVATLTFGKVARLCIHGTAQPVHALGGLGRVGNGGRPVPCTARLADTGYAQVRCGAVWLAACVRR